MTARGSLFAAGLLLVASTATADPDPLHQCLSALNVRIANVGQPRAAEVASDLEALDDEGGRLRSRTATYDETRSAVDGERAELDRLMRERDRLLRQIEVDQQAIYNEKHDLSERIRVHNAEADQQHAAARSAQTEAAAGSASAWGSTINSRAMMLNREQDSLRQRNEALDVQRNQIAVDIIGHGRRLEALQRDSGWADREFSQLMQDCSSLSMRALALLQVRARPGRAEVRQSPDAIAEHVLKDLGKDFTQNVGEHLLEHGVASERVFGAAAVVTGLSNTRFAGRAGLAVKAAKVAWVAAEVLREGAAAGIGAKEREILNNLYLLGDYAEAMRDLVEAEGSVAIDSPEYQAMAQERDRMEHLLPHSRAEVFIQSLRSASTYGGGLLAFIAKYSGQRAASFGAKITNRLNNTDRQVLGRGVTVARETLRAFTGAAGEGSVKEISKAAAEAALRQREGPANPEMRQGALPVEPEIRQGPVTEMRAAPANSQ